MSVSEHTIKTAEKTNFGFWLYILTDCMLFASLFAVFIVLRTATAGGPDGADIFSPYLVLTETMLLLTSSLTASSAYVAAKHGIKVLTLRFLFFTALLGAVFLGIELYEFKTLIDEGHSWRASAFLSSFFVLVGTHGLHITTGLVWIAVLAKRIYSKGLDHNIFRKIGLFTLFWHFLDIVWIFIFSIVYLAGAIQ
jgi:cytochrome o ubiquinol oxidase subunit III